jgi:FtsP/CotA-like multicopper oxidase with cupredoxin domain
VQAPTKNLVLLARAKVPTAFHPLEMDNPDPAQSIRIRHKHMVFYNPNPNAPPFSIDSLNFNDDIINDTINLGSTETWEITNTSGVAHPFHIHDVSFKIIKVSDATNIPNFPIPDYFKGPKDVIFVQNNETISFTASFLDFSTAPCPHNGYMYHCHILSHEDGGMMHQFVVIDPKKKYPPCTPAPKKTPSKGKKSMSM